MRVLMRMQTSVWSYRAALFSALGLSPLVACGGSTGGVETAPPEKTPSGFLSCPPQSSTPGNAAPGYVSCGSGLHRSSKQACTAPPREPGYACTQGASAPVSNGCTVDADCSGKPNGSCDFVQVQFSGCVCDYGCIQDSDCDAGQICVCGERYGRCAQATCTVDSDCKEGALCLSHDPSPGCNGQAFACQSAADQCTSDEDCATGTFCSVVGGTRQCARASCAIGRPFLVGGAARLAPVVRRSDWCSELSPSVAGLSAESRRALLEWWTHVALMEHASIAAFSRFALELVALGAPAALLESTHAAIRDETAHARDAFALASAYGGVPIGPGPFDAATASLAGRSGEDIVLTAIVEGCVGETVAAAEAAEALSRATDGAVREALTKVAADEARHATLAWQFVKWVIAENPAGLRDAALIGLHAVVSAEVGSLEPEVAGGPVPASLAAHGFVDDALRREIRRRVLEDVVAPCALSLTGGSTARLHAAEALS